MSGISNLYSGQFYLWLGMLNLGEKIIRSEAKSVGSEDESIRSEEKSARIKDESLRNEEMTMRSEDETVRSEDLVSRTKSELQTINNCYIVF